MAEPPKKKGFWNLFRSKSSATKEGKPVRHSLA
jgi:hypothetical protein